MVLNFLCEIKQILSHLSELIIDLIKSRSKSFDFSLKSGIFLQLGLDIVGQSGDSLLELVSNCILRWIQF